MTHSDTATASYRVVRSALFVPADRPDRFGKAWAAGADDVILDLEDAVSPERKDIARSNIAKSLSTQQRPLVRINGCDTPWYHRDLELIENPAVAGILVPKAEQLDEGLVRACMAHGKRIIPLVESALGFQQAGELAETAGVERLAFGHLDFQEDVGIIGDDDALLYFRSQLVLISRLAGIFPPLDGVAVDVRNNDLLCVETLRSRQNGGRSPPDRDDVRFHDLHELIHPMLT